MTNEKLWELVVSIKSGIISLEDVQKMISKEDYNRFQTAFSKKYEVMERQAITWVIEPISLNGKT